MNWWKRWMIKLARRLGAYGTLDTEKALDAKQDEIRRLREALAQAQEQAWRKQQVTVEIDKAMQAQAQMQMACYEPPERTTDKPRVLYNTRGRYAQQRWPEFRKTHLMPTVKRPPQQDEPTSLEMTAVRIPTWIL